MVLLKAVKGGAVEPPRWSRAIRWRGIGVADAGPEGHDVGRPGGPRHGGSPDRGEGLDVGCQGRRAHVVGDGRAGRRGRGPEGGRRDRDRERAPVAVLVIVQVGGMPWRIGFWTIVAVPPVNEPPLMATTAFCIDGQGSVIT